MIKNHLVNNIKNPAMAGDNTLHVIGVVTNPARWNSRYNLFQQWKAYMLAANNVKLYVVEGIFGDHQPECAPGPGEDYGYMSVNLDSEIWLKENLINIGVQNLFPPDWNYMMWSDTDVHFENQYWALAAITQLQRFHVIQPWSDGLSYQFDGSLHRYFPADKSFGYLCQTEQKFTWGRHKDKEGYSYAHTGYAWCCDRYFWNNVGGLIDFCLIGSADHHMAWAMIGETTPTVHSKMSAGYFRACYEWQRKARFACGGQVGYVAGVLKHYFHGPSKSRDYGGRWKILLPDEEKGIRGFDPYKDIYYDSQGVIHLKGKLKHRIHKYIMRYNRARKEDSIDSAYWEDSK